MKYAFARELLWYVGCAAALALVLATEVGLHPWLIVAGAIGGVQLYVLVGLARLTVWAARTFLWERLKRALGGTPLR
jgi:hypothetical protein